jgi:hypothetical protein
MAGKKKKKRDLTLKNLRLMTGPLDEMKLEAILWGAHLFPKGKSSSNSCQRSPRMLSQESRVLSNMLQERLREPLPREQNKTINPVRIVSLRDNVGKGQQDDDGLNLNAAPVRKSFASIMVSFFN